MIPHLSYRQGTFGSTSKHVSYSQHDLVRLGDCGVLQMFGIRDWHLDATDTGDGGVQIVERPFHNLRRHFGGKTAGAPPFVDHDGVVRFPHGGQDCRDVEWTEYPEIDDLGRDALMSEMICRFERFPERSHECDERDVCPGSSDCRLCQIDGEGALVKFAFERVQVCVLEDEDWVRF